MIVEDSLSGDPARDDSLILVDGCDREIGTATKAEAHVRGLLHRAFSVVLVRPRLGNPEVRENEEQGASGVELLLSRRAPGKYHSAGLWANSCCSHPRVGEDTLQAAYRRVREELGCEAVGLREVNAFAYRAVFADGLVEYEYDHVLVGECRGDIVPDPTEVEAVRWVSVDELAAELVNRPECFSAWAPMALTLALRAL